MFFSSFRVVAIFIFLCSACLFVVPFLRIDLRPESNDPSITVTYYMDNSPPEIVEQYATSILENAFSQLAHLKKIESKSHYNTGSVTLTFDKHADIAFKRFEVALKIRQTYDKLGPNTSYPLIAATAGTASEKRALLSYTIVAPVEEYEIKQKAEEVFRNRLNTLSGVQEIDISGPENLQISVACDKRTLQAYNISFDQIEQALKQNTAPQYPGIARSDAHEEIFIRTKVAETSLQELKNITLGDAARPVKLGAVADIYLEPKTPTHYFRINGKNSVTLSIYARKGENAIETADIVRQAITESLPSLPPGYRVDLAYDDTKFLVEEVDKMYFRTSLSMAILFTLVLVSYWNWRYSLCILLSVLAASSTLLFLAWICQVNIHLYTLAGISLSFGLMMDNAIVMFDYYRQYRSRRAFTVLLAATLTTVTSLLLVFLLPENEQKNLKDFAVIICLGLSASLLVALFFTPALHNLLQTSGAARASRRRKRWTAAGFRAYLKVVRFTVRLRPLLIAAVILAFGLPVFLLPATWEDHDLYNKTIGSDLYQKKIRPHSDKYLGGALRLFVFRALNEESYVDPQRTALHVIAELPFGATLEQLNDALLRIEDLLKPVPGLDKYITRTQSGQYGHIEITFQEEFEQATLPHQLKDLLIAQSFHIAGVSWRVYGVGRGFAMVNGETTPRFRVIMKGYNYDELENQSNKLARKLVAHERIQTANTNAQLGAGEKQGEQYVLEIDQARLGHTQANYTALTAALEQNVPPSGARLAIPFRNAILPVVIKEKQAAGFSLWNLTENTIPVDGRLVRMKDIARLSTQPVASTIYRENRQYIRIVEFEYFGDQQFGSKYLTQTLEEMSTRLPHGYTAEEEKSAGDAGNKNNKYYLILLLLLGSYLISTILFENFKHPLLILAVVPMAFIGIFVTFGALRYTFDQGGYAAFILCGSLLVNATIFILSDFHRSRRQNPQDPNRIFLKCIFHRGRTILIILISAGCSLIPFLIEGDSVIFWYPMAVGAIGGILASLISIFILTPVLMWTKSRAVQKKSHQAG